MIVGIGIMIAGAGTVIGIMTGTVMIVTVMIVNVIEIQIIPEATIQEFDAGRAQGQRSAPGIMIAIGTCSTISHQFLTLSIWRTFLRS